ncbi:hypothetical protein BDP27DRAFT_1431984 [Rhodocollybia butyracea]|uniref:F-box domain-containing protein n=1 Tax=Rhodocollybia butyracea TaxID=206335 RepID=A0A9P5P7Z8_9AGAR|nr:hypothetical protein BDP27DRAFT_1431984 [Rhodocollybia butyracea]
MSKPAYQALYTELLAKSRHNDTPNSPVTRAALRALIDQTRNDLQTCSESTIRNQISRLLELQESLLAPIRTLPSDVLIEIFRIVIETAGIPGITYTWKVGDPTVKLSGYIFILTWICFWWRNEALSYSAFWSRIAVHNHTSWSVPPRTEVGAEVGAFLNECILRSGVSAPMSIKICSTGNKSTPLAVIAVLVAQAHRWRHVVLLSTSFHWPGMFPSKPSPTRFPLLEDLSCQIYTDSGIDSVQNPILECHPPLQKLELHKLSESYVDIIASWNLKSLKVGCYSGVSFARLLLMCPCLEFLQVRAFTSTGNSDANQVTCQSSLLALAVGPDLGDDCMFSNGPWECVTLPKLTKLDIDLLDVSDHEHWTALLSELKEVIKRSECTLQRVNLFKDDRWPTSVLEMVEKFLQDLPVRLEGCFIDEVPWQEWKANDMAGAYDSDNDSE